MPAKKEMKITQFYNLDSIKINEFLRKYEDSSGKIKLPKRQIKAVLKQLEVNLNIIRHLQARTELLLLRNK